MAPTASLPIKLLAGVVLLGMIAIWNGEEWSVGHNISPEKVKTTIRSSFTGTSSARHAASRSKNHNEMASPWNTVAPRINVKYLPSWLIDYVKFHRQALEQQTQKNNTDAFSSRLREQNYNYLIYTCKQGHHCSGTGNRQRGIMSTFLVAILTKRVFLMDVDNPVPLDQILTPHLIQWNATTTLHQDEHSIHWNADTAPHLL